MSGIGQALSFFSIIPMKKKEELTQRMFYSLVLSGLVLGFVAASSFFILDTFFNGLVSGAASVVLLLYMSGFNHLDGVLDSGDALMAKVPLDQKIAILKDQNTGSGAIGFAVSIYVPIVIFLSLLNPFQGLVVVLFSEVFSKFSYILILRNAKTLSNGIARLFSDLMEPAWIKIMAINLFSILLLSFLISFLALACLPVTLLLTYYMKRKFYSVFNGLNGDLAALNGETVRLAITLFMAVILTLVHGSGISYIQTYMR